MMDFIAHLQQLCLQASTTSSPIGDNTFIARLRAGLPSEFNATQSTIASYLKSHGTVDTNTVDHICAILLDHEVVLENLHWSDSSALWTNPSSGRRDRNRHDRSLSSSLSHAPKPQLQQQPQQHNYSARIPQHNGAQQRTATHSKNMDQFCTFHQAPGHTAMLPKLPKVVKQPATKAETQGSVMTGVVRDARTKLTLHLSLSPLLPLRLHTR
jgi:hypothetical protein